MKPDLPAAVATPAEAQWVEAELVRSLLRTARTSQLLGLFLIPIIVGVLWNDVAWPALALWSACAVALAVVRFAVMRRYLHDVAPLGSAEHLAFFARYRFLWPVSAMVWGASTLLYFDRSSLADQFICWLLLAGLAMFSINALSTHLATLRAYLDTLALTALAVILWRVGVELQFRGPYYHYWIIALLLIFWAVLREAALRLHMTHRRNFELQFRNSRLIESLTRQTQAALDAVEIKNRFLASAAHDIRQPVHALSLYADWLGSEPELVHQLAPKIVESTKAVNALFDSLFDLVRLDSGKIKLNIEPVDLAQLLHDLELQYRPLAQAKGLNFRVHATPGQGAVGPDPAAPHRRQPAVQRRQVHRSAAACCSLRAPAAAAAASRCGTPASASRRCTSARSSASSTRCPAHAGTEDGFGLGLYIVARLSAILGHPIDLASRPGRGTVFRLRLAPTDARQAADRAAASVAQLVSMP